MNEPGQRKLWSIPGDGILARQGNLVLLVSIDEHEFAESLVNLLIRTSEAGGDGRDLADAISAEVEKHQSWGEPGDGPAILAFGPAGNGLAFAVSGTAAADISTAHGTTQLAAGHPSMLLRSVVGVHVRSVRAWMGGDGAGNRTDRFTRLDSGTVRASGLSYLADQPGGAPATSDARSGESSEIPPVPADPPSAPGVRAASQTVVDEVVLTPDMITPPLGKPAPPPVDSPFLQSAVATTPPFTAEPAQVVSADRGFAEPAPGNGGGGVDGSDHTQPGVTGAAPAPVTSVDMTASTLPAPSAGYAPAEPGATGGSPVVLGVYCKNGHFTDPDGRSCVVCGTGIKKRSMAPQPGPRPPLGVLILDDGATLSLNGDWVIGRDPTKDQSVTEHQARPLRVVDAEKSVSRIHARLQLNGWQVLLTDLGSANGTRTLQAGAKTGQVLQPQVPVVLEPGTRIYTGSACIRYERSAKGS